jgi:hypothetical protein
VQADARTRIERVLRARGLFAAEGADPEPLEGHEGSPMPHLWSASLLSQTVTGTGAGQKVPRLIDPGLTSTRRDAPDLPRGALIASSDGYSLHAATRIDAEARDALQRLLRYMGRPTLAMGRLMLREDGEVLEPAPPLERRHAQLRLRSADLHWPACGLGTSFSRPPAHVSRPPRRERC